MSKAQRLSYVMFECFLSGCCAVVVVFMHNDSMTVAVAGTMTIPGLSSAIQNAVQLHRNP